MKSAIDRDIDFYTAELQEAQRDSFYSARQGKERIACIETILLGLLNYRKVLENAETKTEPTIRARLDGRGSTPAFPPPER